MVVRTRRDSAGTAGSALGAIVGSALGAVVGVALFFVGACVRVRVRLIRACVQCVRACMRAVVGASLLFVGATDTSGAMVGSWLGARVGSLLGDGALVGNGVATVQVGFEKSPS